MFRRNRKGTEPIVQFNPDEKENLTQRSNSVVARMESTSAPTTPRNNSGRYCKAIDEINAKLRKSEQDLLKAKAVADDESSSTNSYQSAYEGDEYSYYNEESMSISELGIVDQPPLRSNFAKALPVAARPTGKQFAQIFRQEDSEETSVSSLPKLPQKIPRINLPQKRKPERKSYHYTLSKKLDLNHPCSPRLSESRMMLEQTHKVIELQQGLFDVRVESWKNENSREHSINKYKALAAEAGYQICENCKYLVQSQEEHYKKRRRRNKDKSKENKPRYRCRQQSFNDHFLSTPAEKFFPLSFEKK